MSYVKSGEVMNALGKVVIFVCENTHFTIDHANKQGRSGNTHASASLHAKHRYHRQYTIA